MISLKLIEETKQSDLFKELCSMMSSGTNPASIVLTALVRGIEIGRSQQTFPLPIVTDEDEAFVLREFATNKDAFNNGMNDLFEYMPAMREHLATGLIVHNIDVVTLVAKQLVIFFLLQKRAAERREVEDLEYLVRGWNALYQSTQYNWNPKAASLYRTTSH